MNKHTLLLSPLLFIIFISSCEKSNPVSNGSTNEIIPLKVGNAWTSTFSDYDSNGVITTAYIDSVWVAKDTIVDDQNYFLMFRQSENAVGPHTHKHQVTLLETHLRAIMKEKSGLISKECLTITPIIFTIQQLSRRTKLLQFQLELIIA